MPQDVHALVAETRAAVDRSDVAGMSALYHPNACLPTLADGTQSVETPLRCTLQRYCLACHQTFDTIRPTFTSIT